MDTGNSEAMNSHGGVGTEETDVNVLRILVTDDEDGMRAGVERTLRNERFLAPDVEYPIEFVIDKAETGEIALRIIDSNPPDILLLDHKLPGISGLDVLDHIARQGYEILTVMLTAYASLETAVTATERGAYFFLAKPFTPDALRNTVRKVAAHVALKKEVRRLRGESRGQGVEDR